MYDNYRFKVIALMRDIGIPDEKMVGLPLHFTRIEHEGLQGLTAGQDYDTALNLIRGFISHKVQINSNDVCIANNSNDLSQSNQKLSQQLTQDKSDTLHRSSVMNFSPVIENLPRISNYFLKLKNLVNASSSISSSTWLKCYI